MTRWEQDHWGKCTRPDEHQNKDPPRVTVRCPLQMYGSPEDGSIDEANLSCILKTALGVSELTVTDLFQAIDQEEKGRITFGKWSQNSVAAHSACLRSMRYHTVSELQARGWRLKHTNTHKDRQTHRPLVTDKKPLIQ